MLKNTTLNETLPLYGLKKTETTFKKRKLTSSTAVSEYVRQFYHDDLEIYESCFILMLDRGNNSIGFAKISQGGVSGTVVDIKIIAKYAVESLCSAVILVHNHPSGQREPSQQDINLTKKAKKAMELFDIQLLDHLILTSESYYSFADESSDF